MEIHSGDFLEDLDIEIIIRSGKTDLKILTKLSQALMASVEQIVDSRIVLTEEEIKFKSRPSGNLSSVKLLFKL